ncbi:MAG: phosphoribosylamine--glycine ligase [Tissierellia bacterium]|nr:phosphoribosylamine--glycine ligase [Tissierellia bacterium]
MKILLIGSGAREHALLYAMKKNHPDYDYFAMPGNPGMKIPSLEEAAAMELKWDLVIIGPEDPLARGVADDFRKKGILVFGPGADAAALESSKIFSKNFMQKYDIPTAAYKEARTYKDALNVLMKFSDPPVIKADGLAGGKGVFLPESINEAHSILEALMVENLLGSSGSKVLFEEKLEGPEISFFYLVNKQGYKYLGSARDHKRAYDGGKGPNTGGMGTYSPVPDVDEKDMKQIDEIMERTYRGILAENMDYRGVVFIGCMRTKEGLKVLEYNVRFGDPETQVLMARLESDFLELAMAVAKNELIPEVLLKDQVALCVVLASKGYPNEILKDQPIEIGNLEEDILLFSGGTSLLDGVLVNSSGRVFSLVALGDNFEQAREKVYGSIDRVKFQGMWYRRDIGENLI